MVSTMVVHAAYSVNTRKTDIYAKTTDMYAKTTDIYALLSPRMKLCPPSEEDHQCWWWHIIRLPDAPRFMPPPPSPQLPGDFSVLAQPDQVAVGSMV
jgi:hypothetical protein